MVLIEYWYESVDKMTEILVTNKLTKFKVKLQELWSLDFILGGDHGKDAFRLCFRVVITLNNGTMHYIKY